MTPGPICFIKCWNGSNLSIESWIISNDFLMFYKQFSSPVILYTPIATLVGEIVIVTERNIFISYQNLIYLQMK